MAQMESCYQYKSLPSENCIRLLELYPGQADDTLDCTLRQAELENAPKYEAISYAWGDPTNKVDVLCDGKIITATQNLKDALVRFKLKDRSRFVWADAICINQNDDVEKGSQVKLMNRIYANATRVCAWLGWATVQMQPAFEFIDEIEFHSSPTSTRQAELPVPASECWSALAIFFSAAWFNRLWVVQEVYGHACTVFCGDYEIPWKNIVLVARLLLKLRINDPSVYSLPENAISALQIDSAGDRSASSDIMDTFRHFHCSDQRDRVYALLSFPPLCGLRPLIQPDYSKTVVQVFEEVAVRIFLSSQNLGLLSSVEHDCAIDENWPSWVPRLDRQRQTQILHKYTSGRVQSSLPVIQHTPKILISKGVRISMLSWCGVVIGGAPHGKSGMNLLKQPLQEWLSKYLPIIAHPTDSLLLCIAMTLTVGLDLHSNCPPLDLSRFRLDFLAYLVGILPSLHLPHTARHVLEVLAEPGLAGNSSNYYAAAVRGCKNKRIFSTQTGEFGIGPGAAQTGDHIALLYGGNAPCVLRPKGLYYQFVGECYLHQHMHGEAIEMLARGLFAVEEFEMR
ncbi:heterokaryon incompatibility protein-domain-containing protein [Rhexocercosporidium sp. MPI-PUGE-AT-0058]|nr:heterokaryon incompatibility protein-domain-containing protein [Rhexocercosporidium sp. MPI-PUGE-AT-0058]